MSDTSKAKTKGRDERGVRINNYKESMRGRQPIQNTEQQAPTVLLETFRKSFFEDIQTGDGETVERSRVGRPPKYPTVESFVDKVNEYITYINDTFNSTGFELIPDIEGFCAFSGIDRSTLFDWETSRPPEYSNAIKQLKNAIAAYKKQLAMRGKIPPVVFAIDMNNNHGYIQQQTIDIRANSKNADLPTPDEVIKKLPTTAGNDPTDGDIII